MRSMRFPETSLLSPSSSWRRLGMCWLPVEWRRCHATGENSIWFMVDISIKIYRIHGIYKPTHIIGGATPDLLPFDLFWSFLVKCLGCWEWVFKFGVEKLRLPPPTCRCLGDFGAAKGGIGIWILNWAQGNRKSAEELGRWLVASTYIFFCFTLHYLNALINDL